MRLPQSNGIAEAFVETLKRDYDRLAIVADAEPPMQISTGRFEDYNTIHSHSELRMPSCREFLDRSD